MYHAEKSGHEDFSESQEAIRPLSEEEKKQRLEESVYDVTDVSACQARAEASGERAGRSARTQGQ